MSLGYASRLSHREDLGGRLGAPELQTPPGEVLRLVEQLAQLVRAAPRVIAFTGAGISTACGIPDFRGPEGVWTRERKGLPPPQLQTSFVYARPSLTHMALLGLLQSGKLRYICSQNVDGLHLRSGVPRGQLAELHGNCFAERCKKCSTEYVRDFEMDTVGFKPTGRSCTNGACRGHLVDSILDWEDALPDAELKATQQHASEARVALCLGTSLQIVPAANLPLRTVKAGGSLGIVNLQATPKDKKAAVVIHGKVDEVMALLMQCLGVAIPRFVRTDRVVLSHSYLEHAQPPPPQQQQQPDGAQGHSNGASSGGGGAWRFSLTIASVHGQQCPLPMVASAHVSFVGDPVPGSDPARADGAAAGGDARAEVLPSQELSGQELPWRLERTCPAHLARVTAVVRLQLVEAADADKRVQQVEHVVERPPPPGQQQPARPRSARARQAAQQPAHSQTFSFATQVADYSARQQQLVAQLEAAAAAGAAAACQQQQEQQEQQQQLEEEEASDDADDDDCSSDGSSEAEHQEVDSEALDGESTGHAGQNTSGRPRKRARRLNL